MRLIYIAGKYRAKTEWEVKQNIDRAEAVSLKYWKAGYAVHCPHKNSAFMGGLCPDETWPEGGLEILGRCDGIVMMEDWGDSDGSWKELIQARNDNQGIAYDDQDKIPTGIFEEDFHMEAVYN